MKIKTIVNNCIFNIIKNNKFNKIFIYGSENLVLEKLIFNYTSSPIIGGDVDFFNTLFGKYFCDDKIEINLNNDMYDTFKFNSDDTLSNIDKLALALLYKEYNHKLNNEHNKRIFNNIINNKDKLLNILKIQIQNISLHLQEFKYCMLDEFINGIYTSDLIIIDTRKHNFINSKIINKINSLNIPYIIITNKNIFNFNQILKSQNLNIYSNILIHSKIITSKIKENKKIFNVIENDNIEHVDIKQLTPVQFNSLRQKYISKQVQHLGTPKCCYGLFSNGKLFGVFGITNDYRNKAPKELEQPSIYLLSDFVTNSKIKKLSKLVLYCILSKEVKLLAERLLNKEIKTIYTNVFTKNMSSIKYRNLFVLQDRKQIRTDKFNLTYSSRMGKWSLKEGLKLWKQKL